MKSHYNGSLYYECVTGSSHHGSLDRQVGRIPPYSSTHSHLALEPGQVANEYGHLLGPWKEVWALHPNPPLKHIHGILEKVSIPNPTKQTILP
jgi:hypothetical protein